MVPSKDRFQDKIILKEIEIPAVIGVREEEREYAQPLFVTVVLFTDISEAGKSDDLQDTIDYSDLRDDIVEFVRESRFSLLEKLSEEIARICLERTSVEKVTITTEKPEAMPSGKSASIEITRTPEDYVEG